MSKTVLSYSLRLYVTVTRHNRETSYLRAKTNIRILLVLMSNKALTPLNNNREFCIVFVPLQSVFKPDFNQMYIENDLITKSQLSVCPLVGYVDLEC